MAGLELKNVTKIFDNGIVAVNDVSVTINDGELVVIVGPSGCGKSTLLRLISGLESITAGEINLNEITINELPPKDRDIAMVFQNYALYPHMSVFDNMAFGLKMRKTSKAEINKRVHAAADILGLSEYLDRKPKALSGGQLQRVAVGRTIVRQPALFLFDEPLSNLDARLRTAMRAELIKLHKRLGATMVYVTHDQIEAMSMGDRLVVFKDGVVQQIGPPMEIYNNPANLFVAGFIGSPPMNFLPGKITGENGHLSFSGDAFQLAVPDWPAADLKLISATQQQAILGIRPEDISPVAEKNRPPAKNTVSARIEILEYLGNETLATCRVGNQEIICRLRQKNNDRAGEKVTLKFDVNSIKLFNKNTGARIA